MENSTGTIDLPEIGGEEHRAMWKSRLGVVSSICAMVTYAFLGEVVVSKYDS
jgi:hypothetical protein